MSVTYTKLFSSITESTVWCEPDSTRIVWITMLAMADRKGRVWGSIPGLANRARVSIEKCENALITFKSPDKYSRTPDHEGRRIADIDGGWILLNYEKHRAVQDEETIRESKRQWAERNRESKKVEKVEVSGSRSIQAEAEANAEAPKVKSRCVATASRLPADWQPSEADIAYCNKERPELKVDRVAENFRDYWHAKAGEGARKVNWSATWRTWVRNEKDMRQPPVSQFKSEKQRNMEASMKAIYGPKAPAQTEKLITGEIV